MSRNLKIVAGCILGILAIMVALPAVRFRQAYPYGSRPAAFQIMHTALMNYANEHDGWLPDDEGGPYSALSKLYPSYCPLGRELAGLSGDPDQVQQMLSSGVKLTKQLTSWEYVNGLHRDDDPRIAVLWEGKPGLTSTGRRSEDGSRAVLLLDGSVSNIGLPAWNRFLSNQSQMIALNRKSRPRTGAEAR